jgi:hypothetical protein
MPCPSRKTVQMQPPSPLVQAIPVTESHPSDRSQSSQGQCSRTGHAAEDDEVFDLDATSSNDDYDDSDNDADDADRPLDRPVHCRTRTRGVPPMTGSEIQINDPREPQEGPKGPADIVHFFGPMPLKNEETGEKPPRTCDTCG